jgi:hypothetical protein
MGISYAAYACGRLHLCDDDALCTAIHERCMACTRQSKVNMICLHAKPSLLELECCSTAGATLAFPWVGLGHEGDNVGRHV